MAQPIIRPAERRDAPRLGQLAGELVRQHHRTDPDRFLMVDDVERGYAAWLQRESERRGAVVLVAEQDGAVVGYAYGTINGRDWARLLDDHGEVQDLFVDPTARRTGVGRALLDALVQRLEADGARRVVLMTMTDNHDAQRVVAAAGFRSTMVEMTRSRG